MDKPETIKTLLVELDCLLDTRIATVSKLNEEAAVRLLSPEYYNRNMDDFEALTGGLVTNDQFKAAYAQRDKETLKSARVTEFVKTLYDLCDGYEQGRINSPIVEEFVVTVNTYPYKLTEAEKDYLIPVLRVFCTLHTKVELTYLALEEITPALIKQHYDGVVLYDFNRWFELHHKALDRIPIPRNTMLAPALYIQKPERQEDVMVGDMHVFEVLEMSCVTRLSLELIRAKEFCLMNLQK